MDKVIKVILRERIGYPYLFYRRYKKIFLRQLYSNQYMRYKVINLTSIQNMKKWIDRILDW